MISKGLEALERLFRNLDDSDYFFNGEAREDYLMLEKELKALEIIKENFVPYDIEMLKNGKVRIWVGHDKYFDITKEEYDLLKEVML